MGLSSTAHGGSIMSGGVQGSNYQHNPIDWGDHGSSKRGRTVVVLLRHGETVWNHQGRYQGQLNSDLTKEGERQAELAGKRLGRRFKFDAVVSSDLGRAAQTADIVVKNCESLPSSTPECSARFTTQTAKHKHAQENRRKRNHQHKQKHTHDTLALSLLAAAITTWRAEGASWSCLPLSLLPLPSLTMIIKPCRLSPHPGRP